MNHTRRIQLSFLASLLFCGTTLASTPSSGFLTRGLQGYRLEIVEQVVPDAVGEGEVEIDPSLEKLLSDRELQENNSAQELVDLIRSRSFDPLAVLNVQSIDDGVQIGPGGKVDETSPFRISVQTQNGRVCPEWNGQTFLTSSRQRESLGGELSGVGFGFGNHGAIGQFAQFQYGMYASDFAVADLSISYPLGMYDCGESDWVRMLNISYNNTQVDLTGFEDETAQSTIQFEYRKKNSVSDEAMRIGLVNRKLRRLSGGNDLKENQVLLDVSYVTKPQILNGNRLLDSSYSFGLRFGLDALGATAEDDGDKVDRLSDVQNSEFYFSHQRVYRVSEGLDFDIDLRASGSNHNLPSGRGFSFGRDVLGGIGSAYDAGEFTGDWGVGTQLRFENYHSHQNLKTFLVYDVARVGKNCAGCSVTSGASGAIGFDWISKTFKKHRVRLKLEISKPLTSLPAEEGSDDFRVFASLCLGKVGTCSDLEL